MPLFLAIGKLSVCMRVYANLVADSHITVEKEDISTYVPEYKKATWSTEPLSEIDFTDATKKHSWPKSGLAWDDSYIGGNVQPTPHVPIESQLIDVIERKKVHSRYYLTPNAAEGILRRVDNQGRTLFPPLRTALENEMKKAKENDDE